MDKGRNTPDQHARRPVTFRRDAGGGLQVPNKSPVINAVHGVDAVTLVSKPSTGKQKERNIPVWLMRHNRPRDESPRPARGKSRTKQMDITISLPPISFSGLLERVKWPFVMISKAPKKWIILGGVAVLLVVTGLIALKVVTQSQKKAPVVSPSQPEQGEHQLDMTQTPDYKTLLPKDKSIQDLGGWARVSPADREPVFAFADKVAGVPVTVSQQPLPATFKPDIAGSIAKLAEQFNARQKVVAGEVTAYVGTSAQGPQSVIFEKDNLLILIKSQSKVSDEHWKTYIDSLR